MRKLGFVTAACFLILFFSASLLTAGNYTGTARFTPGDIVTGRSAGFDTLRMEDGDNLAIPGSPVLPCVQVNVALPCGSTVRGVRFHGASFSELEGTYDVIPAVRPRWCDDPAPPGLFVKDSAVYGKDAFFPERMVEQIGPKWDLAGQEFVTLRLYPVQYNPRSGKVRVATSLSYEVAYDVNPAFARKTYNFSPRVRDLVQKRLERTAVNPGQVAPIPAWSGPTSRVLAPGDYEHVVITTTSFEHEFDTLVNHYTLTGVPSTVVTLTWIYANYSGSNNQEKIRNFVIDAHSEWGATYFLLGGDQDLVPCKTTYMGGDNIPNDTYYADFDDDWKCEVYVGRAAVNTASEIGTFLTKTLDYMTAPPSGFGEEVFLMGFDLDSVTRGEGLMNYIIARWMPGWVDLSKEYDSESGGHEQDCKDYINAGQNLIAHCDHCNWNVVGVGYYHHGTTLSISECKAFHNGERRGLMNTLGCWPGAYDYSDCWGEEFVKDSDGGGVAFVGNSRYGWYMPGAFPEPYSGRYLQKYFKVVWQPDYNDFHAGEALGECKNDYYPTDDTYRYIFTEVTLFGDPALPLWTDVPQVPAVTFDSSIDPGLQSFTVSVKAGGSDVEGALVCVWKDTQVYERKTTNGAGNADFIIDPLDAGTMSVTVSGLNLIPTTGTCTVNSGNIPDLSLALILDKANYTGGEDINYDLAVANGTGSPQSTELWLNITLPGGGTYPSSGYLGTSPWPLTIDPNDIKTATLSMHVPKGAPLGSYMFNAFIGPNPGIVDEDHKPFSIVN